MPADPAGLKSRVPSYVSKKLLRMSRPSEFTILAFRIFKMLAVATALPDSISDEPLLSAPDGAALSVLVAVVVAAPLALFTWLVTWGGVLVPLDVRVVVPMAAAVVVDAVVDALPVALLEVAAAASCVVVPATADPSTTAAGSSPEAGAVSCCGVPVAMLGTGSGDGDETGEGSDRAVAAAGSGEAVGAGVIVGAGVCEAGAASACVLDAEEASAAPAASTGRGRAAGAAYVAAASRINAIVQMTCRPLPDLPLSLVIGFCSR